MSKGDWIKIGWDEGTESHTVALVFECAPPGHHIVDMAFGDDELRELVDRLSAALRAKESKE